MRVSLRALLRRAKGFPPADGGNVALLFCVAAPVLIAVAGLGVDSAGIYDQQTRMQSVADSTALAVGKEMNLYLQDLNPLTRSGKDRAETLLREVGLADRPHTIDITLDAKKASSHVAISMETRTFLPAELWGRSAVHVEAEAGVLGKARLCVLSLDGSASRALELDGLARVTAPDCVVQSNSKDSEGLSARHLSVLISSSACTAGGYEGDLSLFVPPPETDCPKLDDPLEMREPPAVGSATSTA